MAEFNAETNKVSGSKKTSVYFQGSDPESKIITPSKELTDITGKPLTPTVLKNAKAEVDIPKEKQLIKEYNESLKTITEDAKSFIMNGNILVIRLFKHDPYVMSDDNPELMLMYNPIMVPYKDPNDGGAIKGIEAPLQYLNRGVIVNMSGQYSDFFTSNFKVGDIVDIKLGASLMLARFWISPESYVRNEFDNYFSFNENMIEKKILS